MDIRKHRFVPNMSTTSKVFITFHVEKNQPSLVVDMNRHKVNKY
jgi:hypothetical protein